VRGARADRGSTSTLRAPLLLTGATGFIGRHLLGELAPEYEVHAVTSSAPPDTAEVIWHRADLLESGSAARLIEAIGPTHLVHLAWYAEHGRFWESEENVRWVGATLELLRAFAAAGGRRALAIGTCAEYDWSTSPCVEGETPLKPATLYGVCKDATRRVSEALAQRSELELAWARPFLLYGPGEDPRRLIPHVARSLLGGTRAEVTDGTAVRDFLHVRDVAAALRAVLDSDLVGPVNICSGRAVSLREVIETVAAAAGSPELVAFGAIPQRAGEPQELLGSAARLRERTGFAPALTLEQGLAETVEWWRSELRAARA